MKVGRYFIEGKNCRFALIDFLDRELNADYRSSVNDGAIFFTEYFSMINSSDLMVVINVQPADGTTDRCVAEIVAGGGGKGVFHITFGNERRRLNGASDLIYEFCKRHNFIITQAS